MTILNEIIQYKKQIEIPQRMNAEPMEIIQKRAELAPAPLDFIGALRARPGVALIAEVKRASPSKGLLSPDFNPLLLADTYVSNGASAISVLTDERYFQGSLEHLVQIRQKYPKIPILRKDFTVHPYQVYEARACGADAVLLIASALQYDDFAELYRLANSLNMTALIEVHNQEELENALKLKPNLIGINNRNLHDFTVDLQTCLTLRKQVPENICTVAESGIFNAKDVRRLKESKIDAMLVGEALIRADDRSGKVRELIHAGQN